MSLKLNLILNKTKNNVIGIDNKLLFKIKDDLLFFKNITSSTDDKKNIIIMGFNTWVSIPNKPLENRINIILTKDKKKVNVEEDVYVFSSFSELFSWLVKNTTSYNKIFIIGGSSIFDQILTNYRMMINNIYITEVDNKFYSKEKYNLSYFNDTLKDFSFSEIDKLNLTNESVMYNVEKKQYEKIDIKYKFLLGVQNKNNNSEKEYLNLLKTIIKENNIKISRNSKVYSKFGVRMEFNLLDGFPLLTTKKMPWKTILRELIWFINGETDNKILNNKKVHIWDLNSTKEFLESRNLSYEIEGDLGPIYGFQWRHCGAEYIDCDTDYKNKGVDQLKYVINEIKTNPSSRRIIMSSWNPIDIPKMALPPCHVMVQFNVEPPFIDAQLYQRSGDMFLGVPFNIASYSFLLSIIAKICNYIPRKLIHIIGDAHIYENHIEAVNTQLSRIINNMPILEIKQIEDIDNITEDMFQIYNYNPEPTIKAQMIP
tara:strand:- start:3103 stop:4554 length:1452 start_codon:yes stop_codon:yes gene_type:complete